VGACRPGVRSDGGLRRPRLGAGGRPPGADDGKSRAGAGSVAARSAPQCPRRAERKIPEAAGKPGAAQTAQIPKKRETRRGAGRRGGLR
jgi:hypothetical protein